MVRSLRTHATATDGVPTRIRAVHATLLLHLVILSAEVARYWTLDHNSPGCQFLAYRLVAALPYPAVVVLHQGGGDISTPRTPSRATRQPPQAPNPSDRPNTPGLMPSIVQRLGAVFDHVCGPKNRLRAFASQWATWSNARIHALAEGYRCALAPAVAGQLCVGGRPDAAPPLGGSTAGTSRCRRWLPPLPGPGFSLSWPSVEVSRFCRARE